MMRRLLGTWMPTLGLLATVALSGCCHVPLPDPTKPPSILPYPAGNYPDSPTMRRAVTVEPPFDVCAEVCPAWRHLGVKRRDSDACPLPSSVQGPSGPVEWQVSHLFYTGDSPDGSSAEALSLAPGLRRFCVYETDATGDTLDALQQSLQAVAGLERVDPTCAALRLAADRDKRPNQLWPTLRQYFLEREGGAAWSQGIQADQPKSELAILDTQPLALQGSGNSPHGFSMGQLARWMLCEGAACRATIRQELALPITNFDPADPTDFEIDSEGGGFYGTIDDLALAVHRVLEQAESPQLVINLSVAWVGETFGGLEKATRDMPGPVQALWEVLRIARCRKALVLAAAGNRVGGPEQEFGPLLPAAWEQRRAPSPKACGALLGQSPEDPGASPPVPAWQPLVYAVAGVRGDGTPLVNARPESLPPRVAFGDHAPGGTVDDPRFITGSSVATLVASASAAALWHERPDLEPAAVMEALYGSGSELPGRPRADFHGGKGPAPEVRWISQCQALAALCNDAKSPCSSGSVRCNPLPVQPRWPKVSRDLACEEVRVNASQLVERLGEAAPICGTFDLRFDPDGGLPLDPCPFLQFYGIQARHWTGPQPGADPCSSCSSRPPPADGGSGGGGGFRAGEPTQGYSVEIFIDDRWPELIPGTEPVDRPAKIRRVFLDIGDVSYSLDLQLEPGDCARVVGIDESLIAPPEAPSPPIALRFLTDYGSFESPILITD